MMHMHVARGTCAISNVAAVPLVFKLAAAKSCWTYSLLFGTLTPASALHFESLTLAVAVARVRSDGLCCGDIIRIGARQHKVDSAVRPRVGLMGRVPPLHLTTLICRRRPQFQTALTCVNYMRG